ncbi:thiol:disulfide interchange protein [Mesorhizobium sp. LSJC268A00]|jgi:cytochrome c biogenesis protein CcmG/thiol:disulfide interchange protein DsbE|uniref:DsbE family thiol:disulfide interchange protein n=1 Tax=unclassified Mesorhizobium TaxID=325217 RepID=UPI0003CE761B|nr:MULTISPECIES: DsbE family thiol:disulfide interchange protein [unclassified Mesorhizobium]ESW90955.1 thiol:disulfide interchange protein [Mesorhizobium sp. LSJC269B00]ESW95378.1 thiol:disulfide interchange protein [Mesorhizobium sp. LSJC268A00]ESZ05352.1 thiol:disulfide interchange protein [Mesorhizobium sp. L2C089B000]ESZ14033.1 thiol:disulfide interchange protein [Mesorhizobium sp. L2C085B000]WJI49245.1 DsbE family thiol:disulfide interchange protein [Mesorhizobium sp. C089B]
MSTESETPASPRRRLIVLLPLLVFLGLAGLFLSQLLSGRDEAAVPSALIGLPAPQTNLPALEGSNLPGLDSKAFAGKVTLVNVFASWCAPCREEHPVLLQLSQDKRFVMAALNYKDQAQNARRFLGDLGNPFQAIGVDEAGRTAIDWGVYGVPETFVIGKDGKIAYKHVGPLTGESARDVLLPQIEKALAAPG